MIAHYYSFIVRSFISVMSEIKVTVLQFCFASSDLIELHMCHVIAECLTGEEVEGIKGHM